MSQTLIENLIQGHQRYLTDQSILKGYATELSEIKGKGTKGTEIIVITCIDPRIPVERVFDQAVGSMFVARTASGYASDEALANLELALLTQPIGLILNLLHTDCAAIKAALSETEFENSIVKNLRNHIQTDSAYDDSLQKLKNVSEERIKSFVKKSNKKAEVASAIFDCQTGKINFS